jgi:hypothetical protein
VLVGPRDRSGRIRKTVKKLMTDKKVGVLAEQGGFLLLRKGADPMQNNAIMKR